MRTNFLLGIFCICLTSCEPTTTAPTDLGQATAGTTDSTLTGSDSTLTPAFATILDESADTLTEEEKLIYAWYYIVVADTGIQYAPLFDQLKSIEKKTQLPVNLMGRYFDKRKKQIMLPENDEDELYAGSYFPRRFPEKSLSVEYLSYFREESNENSLAIIAGITEGAPAADSLLRVVKSIAPTAFTIKSKVYIGCLH